MNADYKLIARLHVLAGSDIASTIAHEFAGQVVSFSRAPEPERAQRLAPGLKFPDGSGFDIDADIRVYESSATIWVDVRDRGRWVCLEWLPALAILQLRRELAAVRRALQSKSDGNREGSSAHLADGAA